MTYVNLEAVLFQSTEEEFTVRVAETPDEACDLVQAGFDYVTDFDGAKIFSKRKQGGSFKIRND